MLLPAWKGEIGCANPRRTRRRRRRWRKAALPAAPRRSSRDGCHRFVWHRHGRGRSSDKVPPPAALPPTPHFSHPHSLVPHTHSQHNPHVLKPPTPRCAAALAPSSTHLGLAGALAGACLRDDSRTGNPLPAPSTARIGQSTWMFTGPRRMAGSRPATRSALPSAGPGPAQSSGFRHAAAAPPARTARTPWRPTGSRTARRRTARI